MELFIKTTSVLSDVVQICVGLAALILAWTQRDKISAALSILFNYSFQLSLANFKHWVKILQENCHEDEDTSKKFRTALAHIYGKIKGNPTLYKYFGDKILKRLKVMMADLDEGKLVNQTEKTILYSEIEESLGALEIVNYKSQSRNYE